MEDTGVLIVIALIFFTCLIGWKFVAGVGLVILLNLGPFVIIVGAWMLIDKARGKKG